MNTHSPKRRSVESGIRAAFAGVTLGTGISLRHAQLLDSGRAGAPAAESASLPPSGETERWDRIASAELESDHIAHLDPEGFRFYLPALMISLLDDYVSSSMRCIGTLSALYPKERIVGHHMPRYDLLTLGQKQAVACFLEALPDLVALEGEDKTVVKRAMRFWAQYLPTGGVSGGISHGVPVVSDAKGLR